MLAVLITLEYFNSSKRSQKDFSGLWINAGPMLPVSLDSPILISPSGFSNVQYEYYSNSTK
jgi:hypothetical protein